jgi:hypothetical protein
VATKFVVLPFATLAVGGVTTTYFNSGAVTVNVTGVEVYPPAAAVMSVVPCNSEDAVPEALMVATV